jgi:hypothetical protein
MAFVLADWSITRNGGALDLRYIGAAHTGAATYATTIELHRGLADLADNETETSDDQLSIITKTPSDRGGADTNISLLNGCNIDDTASQHIYDGSITQNGGNDIYDGIQVFGNSTNIQVIQNGSRIIDDFWNYANMITATEDALSSTSHRFCLLVRSAGADIDGRRLLGTQRELGTIYTEFFIGGGTNRGNNVLALTANSDGNNQTIDATIAGWDTIVNQNEGYVGIDANGDAADEFYYSRWTIAALTKNDLYERAKWIQTRVADIGVDTPARDADQTIYGLPGDIFRGITHEITVDNHLVAAFVEPESLSWGTGATAGTGQLLACDDVTQGNATKLWIQLLSGVAPTDGLTITGAGTATADVNVTVTPRLLSACFIGTSTGSAINTGAYGIGILASDLTQNDKLVDLTDTERTPPNNVTYTVNNVVVGDRLLVTNNNGGDIDFAQFVTNAAYSGAVTAIVSTTAIPTDTPASGTIRLELDTGEYQRIAYSSYTGSTFTVSDTLTSAAASGNNLFISYIDKVVDTVPETVTWVHLAGRTVFTRVRNATAGGSPDIKTFETTALVGAGGGSSTVGRIDDF